MSEKVVDLSKYRNMKIVLSHLPTEAGLGEMFRQAFKDVPDVEVYTGSILDLDVDAIVSPANSFGFMDGGIDVIYSRHFGWDLSERVQSAIKARSMGELLVGEAIIVPTNNSRIPWLVAAPTMRTPMIIRDTVNAYLAAKAALIVAKENGIKSIAFPGMGTGVGRLPPDIAALQMRFAYEEIICGNYTYPESLMQATDHRYDLMGGRTPFGQL